MKEEDTNVSAPSDEKTRLCGAKTRAGVPCAKIGLANGRCRQHGGLSTGPRLKHGRRASKTGPARRRLSERAEKFETMTNPLNLSRELAFLRAIFEEWLEENDAKNLHPASRAEAIAMVSETSKLIERIERIRNNSALTQSELQFIQATMNSVIKEFLDPEKARAFILKMRAATGARDEEMPRAPVVLRALPEGATDEETENRPS